MQKKQVRLRDYELLTIHVSGNDIWRLEEVRQSTGYVQLRAYVRPTDEIRSQVADRSVFFLQLECDDYDFEGIACLIDQPGELVFQIAIPFEQILVKKCFPRDCDKVTQLFFGPGVRLH